MKLVLLRHALQESTVTEMKESPGLSLKGKKQQQSTNQHLLDSGVRLGCVYSSPVRRAVETAQIVGECFSCPVVIEKALGSDFLEERLVELLQDSPQDAICFIGHAPTLPDFAQFLVGEIPIPDIGRSSALILEVEKNDGRLQCRPIQYITPEGVAQTFEV
jgi:phosphohistidine phosphatase SixA